MPFARVQVHGRLQDADDIDLEWIQLMVNKYGLLVLTNITEPLTATELHNKILRTLAKDDFLRKVESLRISKERHNGNNLVRLGGNALGRVGDFPHIRKLGNSKDGLFCKTGLEWHSDGLHTWTILHCWKTPVENGGGETLFSDAFVAFERLDAGMKEWASNAVVVYSSRFTAGKGVPSAVDFEFGLRMNPFGTKLLKPAQHRIKAFQGDTERFRTPIVFYHAERKRHFLSIDTRHMEFFEGHSVSESRDLLDKVLKQALGAKNIGGWCTQNLVATDAGASFRKDVVFRHKWSANDVVIWDNDAVLHSPSATAPYQDMPGSREMLQCIFPPRKPNYCANENKGLSERPGYPAKKEYISSSDECP